MEKFHDFLNHALKDEEKVYYYVDFTKLMVETANNYLESLNQNYKKGKMLILGGNSNLESLILQQSENENNSRRLYENYKNLIIEEPNESVNWFEYMENYFKSDCANDDMGVFERCDFILGSRILEHISFREMDYFIYLLRKVSKQNAKLIFTVPNMDLCSDEIKKLTSNLDNIDSFKLFRLNIEIFNEFQGSNKCYDLHKIWFNENLVKYFFEREKYFNIEYMKNIYLDTDLIPKYILFIASVR